GLALLVAPLLIVLMQGETFGNEPGSANLFAVRITSRPDIVAGQESWYEVTIRNKSHNDEIIDLTAIEETDARFVGRTGSGGFKKGTIADKMSAQRCGDIRGWIKLRHDEAATTLIRVLTPRNIEGPMSLRIGLTLQRIVNLGDCTSRSV